MSICPMTYVVWQSMQWPTGPARYSPYLTMSVFGTSGTLVTSGPKPFSGIWNVLRGTSLRTAGTDLMYLAIARASVSDMLRYQRNDIGGPRYLPSGVRALWSTSTMSSSLHEPMPVSMSGVMFGAYALNTGSSITNAPARFLVASGVPSGSRGVWQLPQPATVSTR